MSTQEQTTIKAPTMNGDQFRAWRKGRNLTQAEAGELFGVDQRTIIRYEKDELPIPPAVRLATIGAVEGRRVEVLGRYRMARERAQLHIDEIDARKITYQEARDGGPFLDVTAQRRQELVDQIDALDPLIRMLERDPLA